jgi:hypothetical protein
MRAIGYLFLAALTAAVMIVVRTGHGTDFLEGLWLGLLFGCALTLMPIKRWLRPNSEVVRLLEDESARAHRQMSCTVGFWAAIVVGLLFQLLGHFDQGITAEEAGQLVATAGIVCAITSFAILELRAAR